MLTTVSDRKIGVYSNGSLTLPNDSVVAVVDYYEPHMVNATDYYAFGMPSRVASSATGQEYRFGFNGKENDNAVKGFGNQQDYGMRIYDARVGRFLSVDPLQKDYPWLSPFAFAENSPIANIDLDGLETIYTADGRRLTGPLYKDPLTGTPFNFSRREIDNPFFTYNIDHSKSATAKKPAAQPNLVKSDATTVVVNASVKRVDEAMRVQAEKKAWQDYQDGKGGLTMDQLLNGSPYKTPKLIPNPQFKGPDPRRGYTDFEYGMISSPATQASTAVLCPECYVVYGGAQVNSGIETGNKWEITAGILNIAGSGIFGSFGKNIPSPANIQEAVWAQTTFSNTFGTKGTFAGKTIDDVVGALKNATLSTADVPIDVIVRNGQTFILNTRSSVALTKAGIPRSSWNIVDRTGQEFFEKQLTDQFGRNASISGTGTNAVQNTTTKEVVNK